MNEAGMDRTKPEKCPQCGASLPVGALAGFCPACLLHQGAAADTATAPNAKPFVLPTVEEVARLFPQLEILGFLGKGGMGAVYKARQPALDRIVALKILPTQEAVSDPGFAERFTREARALARLSHPNIVVVYEFGQVNQSSAGVPPAVGASGSGTGGIAGEQPAGPGGTPALSYFIMEFVDGVNLRQLQKAKRLSPREALQVVPQICDALQYAHDEGVVHRDIKPENVLVDRKGRVKIADFGLAKILGQDTEALRLTGKGQVMGTPHYMAPEQVEHPLTVDHRADIFSLGVVFYEMLTGELPLGKFQPPSCRVQVDVRLDDVVLHALEKEPERRYQHVSEVKTDVEKIASGALPPGETFGQLVEAQRRKRINCVPALSLYCLTNTLLVAANMREFTGHTDYFLAPYVILAWIVGGVFWSMMHYSCWKALPEKFRATTPGRALGFLFIPLFNFYWFFVSFPKLATGFNALKRERPELAIRNLRGVGIAYAITTVLVFTLALNHPGWACLIFVADLVLTFVFYLGTVANANLVIEASQAARAPKVAASQRTAMSEPPRSAGRAWKIAAAVIVAVVALNCVIAVLALRSALSKSPPASGAPATPRPAKARAPVFQPVITTPQYASSGDIGNADSALNRREPVTGQSQPQRPTEASVSVVTNTEVEARTKDIARLKLELAERELDEVAKKQQVGIATPSDFEKAKIARDIAAAELKGDAVAVARLKLQITEVDLRVIKKMVEVGRATPLDYDKAKLAREVAAAEYFRQQQLHGK
jgi:hypothetical protein